MSGVRVFILAAATILTGLGGSLTARPVHAENVVKWARASGMPSWEPSANDSESWEGLGQVYEGLTLSDHDASLHPALATSWSLVTPNTWRFELRQGVRFHDGSPLTAADVAFSLNRDRAPTSDRAYLFAAVQGVTPISENAVEVSTAQPDLLLPVKLRVALVIPEAWAYRHGAERPRRPDDRTAHTFAHANGAGPFALESFDSSSKQSVLVKNPNWWGLDSYPHNVDRIVWTAEPHPERRLALLADGRIDLLNDAPPDRLDRLRGVPGISIFKVDGMRLAFLGLDQASAELRTSDVKGRNPFADRRVRRALSCD